MKKLLLISILCLCSCSTYKMSNKEIKNLKYEVDGWDIIKDDQCVANIREMEWELYEGKLTVLLIIVFLWIIAPILVEIRGIKIARIERKKWRKERKKWRKKFKNKNKNK